jgi:two-component system, chemotaxis family, protein-glutamate methylesterase/glutaminase
MQRARATFVPDRAVGPPTLPPVHARDPAAAFDIVGIGASAGGLKALTTLLSTLPLDFPAPLVVVQHLDPRHRSLMPEILARRTRLRVEEIVDGQVAQRGWVYMAPPGHHVLVGADGTLSLTESPLVHWVRPSVDTLLTSIAQSYGPRALAIILTGSGSDGADGVRAIKGRGGTVIVQDEPTSEFYGMPGAALKTDCVDQVVSINQMADVLVALVMKQDV